MDYLFDTESTIENEKYLIGWISDMKKSRPEDMPAHPKYLRNGKLLSRAPEGKTYVPGPPIPGIHESDKKTDVSKIIEDF